MPSGKRAITGLRCLLCFLLLCGCLPVSLTAAAQETAHPIRVLCLGNSFSKNAVAYLEDIAKAGQTDMTIGNLVIASCSLQMHWSNMELHAASYQYYKYTPLGYAENAGVTLDSALAEEDWDYITLQQVSGLSGDYGTFQPYLDKLVEYLHRKKPRAEILLHETWAYENSTASADFSRYNKSQDQMFRSISDAYAAAARAVNARVIPAAAAFQKARALSLFNAGKGGVSLCVDDGCHASEYGQYLLGALWFEFLTGKSVLDNSYTRPSFTDTQRNALRQTADDTLRSFVQPIDVSVPSSQTDGGDAPAASSAAPVSSAVKKTSGPSRASSAPAGVSSPQAISLAAPEPRASSGAPSAFSAPSAADAGGKPGGFPLWPALALLAAAGGTLGFLLWKRWHGGPPATKR